ncbi:lipase chaperone LimK [Halospina denitrificans]|uniref:Lipase chaperone n=1 Tax=Halospina denitrificans TaxID=332522 RepID=A0A4R7JYV5_9GAMM|nr:lipase secretion chaperone [Halospina denitrificans]TDT43405.1 lipase chaperone LimK [Halospina denitrificans]
MSQTTTFKPILFGTAVLAATLLIGIIALLAQSSGSSERAESTEPAGTGPETAAEDSTSPGEEPGIVNANRKDVKAAYATRKEWEGEPFTSSLQGTEIDGSLKADAQGRLIVDLETRDFFDYFLNTVGEVEEGEAVDQIRALAESHLPESAVMEAMDLLEHYIDYKEEAIAINSQPVDREAAQSPQGQMRILEQGLADMKRARRDTLPPEAVDAFFSLEEAYGEFTLQRMQIQRNSELSAQEKQQQLRLAEEQLPEPIRETERHIQETNDYQQQVKQTIDRASSPDDAADQLKRLGLSDEQVESIAEQMHSDEQFEDRYADYRRKREELLESGLSEQDREQTLERLRKKHFESRQARSKAQFRDLDG